MSEGLWPASRPFLEWVGRWREGLAVVPLTEVVTEPAHTAVLAVDVLEGFCSQGPLASERVGAIVAPIARLMTAAEELGVPHFILIEDRHPADAVEFGSYPPHCMAGTVESETAAGLAALPFAGRFLRLEKNSISSSINTGLDEWLEGHPEVNRLIVVGDCTDLCTYHLAMYLRLRANALQLRDTRVVVPADCVNTYDMPVDVAEKIGAVPHDADLLHLIFLYSMMLNGIEVVASLEG